VTDSYGTARMIPLDQMMREIADAHAKKDRWVILAAKSNIEHFNRLMLWLGLLGVQPDRTHCTAAEVGFTNSRRPRLVAACVIPYADLPRDLLAALVKWLSGGEAGLTEAQQAVCFGGDGDEADVLTTFLNACVSGCKPTTQAKDPTVN
jgi:hypothetical protein